MAAKKSSTRKAAKKTSAKPKAPATPKGPAEAAQPILHEFSGVIVRQFVVNATVRAADAKTARALLEDGAGHAILFGAQVGGVVKVFDVKKIGTVEGPTS